MSDYSTISLEEARAELAERGKTTSDKSALAKRARGARKTAVLTHRNSKRRIHVDVDLWADRTARLFEAMGSIIRTLVVSLFLRLLLVGLPVVFLVVEFYSVRAGFRLSDILTDVLPSEVQQTAHTFIYVVSDMLALGMTAGYMVLSFITASMIVNSTQKYKSPRFSLRSAWHAIRYMFGLPPGRGQAWKVEYASDFMRAQSQRSLMAVAIATVGTLGRMSSVLSLTAGDIAGGALNALPIGVFALLVINPFVSLILLGAVHFISVYIMGKEGAAQKRRQTVITSEYVEDFTEAETCLADRAELLVLVAALTKDDLRRVKTQKALPAPQQMETTQPMEALPPVYQEAPKSADTRS